MSKKQETIADIVRWLRGKPVVFGFRETNNLADRLEAAWKREKSQSWHHREMEELILRHEKEVAELKNQTGNAAAMREALVWLQKTGHRTPEGGWMCINLKTIQKDGRPYPIEVPPYAEDVINAALSAPPKNCDRFRDELDAQLAFLNEVWLISVDRYTMLERDKFENWSDEMKTRYGRWLLAPAAEMEGGKK